MWNAMDYPASSLVGLLGLHGDLWSKRDPDFLRFFPPQVSPFYSSPFIFVLLVSSQFRLSG